MVCQEGTDVFRRCSYHPTTPRGEMMTTANDEPPGGPEELMAWLARGKSYLATRQGKYILSTYGRDILVGPGEGIDEMVETLEIETEEDLKRINDQIREHPEFGAGRG